MHFNSDRRITCLFVPPRTHLLFVCLFAVLWHIAQDRRIVEILLFGGLSL